ncbi:heliorhodopsin HeR [Candidatus Izemoplasma sp. B36]|uniref:heliorhodopsin HeR n=1 Tax=Candidatus Izemoplasma sp. B36 TaxID=3242468 RepID=UPI0035578534
MENEKLLKLRKFNMIMGGLHLIQGIIMLILAGTVIQNISEFKPTITQIYLFYNTNTMSLETGIKQLFDLPFGVLVAVFLLLSALAHAIISLPKFTNDIYNKDLEKGINKFRWFEYALSSSVMIVLIATLFGVYDIATLLLIFVVNALMNIFGLYMEKLNSGRDKKNINWGPFVYGTIAGLLPWVVIIIYMTGNGNYDMVPWFVWAIVGTYFVAFNTFPINMILQYKGIGKWKDYLYGERTYIVLSLVAKSILAWLVLFGAMQP